MARTQDDQRYPEEAGVCALSRWSGDPASCRWCDAPTRSGGPWCGHLCEDEYRRNHWWDHARAAAAVRDGERCVRCGLGPEIPMLAKLLLRALVPMGARQAASLWRSPGWAALRQACTLEVHHVVAREGCGYGAGCHHHLDGLETLCHRCHAVTTAQQQHERFTRRSGLADTG